MKKQLIALSIISLICIGICKVNASASDFRIKDKHIYNINNKSIVCNHLSEEERKLMEQGYNELSEDEKLTLEKYRGQCRTLNEDELKEYYTILDKMYKYMDEDFKVEAKEKREQRKNKKGNIRCKENRNCIN